MNLSEVKALILNCSFPDYDLQVLEENDQMYLQAHYMDFDTNSHKREWQTTRKWLLDKDMSKSAIVQTAFKCILTSHEHRVREWFQYGGMPVYNPHYNVDDLWKLCKEGKISK